MIESDSETESEYDVDKKTHKISFNNGSKQEVNKLNEIFDKIKNIIDLKQDYIFINNKIIVTAKTMKGLKEKIKNEFDPPEKDIKCFIVGLKINPNYKYPLTINCSQFTITPKLSLVYKDDDTSQTFTYSEKELLDYGFSMDHLKSIMKALKKELVSFEKSAVTITSVFKALENQPKKVMKEIEESIKEVEKLKPTTYKLKKLVKADKEHLKYHPSEQDKQELKADEASLLLSPYKYENKNLVKQLYDSINTYPEFDYINKQKIKKYSFVVVDEFNKKHHDLMLRLFKTEKNIDKLLLKKLNNIDKKKVSEEKAEIRKKKYAEAAKEERKVKAKEKVKHLDVLTPEEYLKFQQARNYYMRKSKTSNILPKNLNKDDPDGLNYVCQELAQKGFDTMSEFLFMKFYEG